MKSSKTTIALIVCGCLYVAALLLYQHRNEQQQQRQFIGDALKPPYVEFLILPTHTRMIVSNESDYSAHAVNIDLYEQLPNNELRPIFTRQYQEIAPHTAPIVGDLVSSDMEVRHFFARIATRVDSYGEQIILKRRDDGSLAHALRVINDGGIVLERIDSAFPIDAQGRIEWPPR